MRDRSPLLLAVLPFLFVLHCSSQSPAVVESDGGTGGPGGPDLAVLMDPHGPRILSLGTSVKQVTQGESARFVAVITHPDGLDNLAGGQLTSPDGAIKYGAFQADHQGSYTLDLSWALLHQTQPIGFASEEMRSFIAEFFDMQGHKTAQSLSLRLHCNGKNACDGVCLAQGDRCSGGSANLCISGLCKPGCFIDGALAMTDANNPDPDHGLCLACKPKSNDHDWTQASSGTTCGTNKKCNNGDCGNAFSRRTITGFTYPIDVWGSSASNVYAIGRDFSSNVYLINSTDGGMSWQTASGKVPFGYYESMWGTGTSTLYLAGSSGVIAKTTNGGTSWTTLTTGVTASLRQIWGSSGSDVWAVGSGGTVLRSTDGGTTWQKLTVPSAFAAKELTAVWGSSSTDVYIGTETGAVLRTTNSGATFTTIKTKHDDYVTAIWGSGKSDVYVTANSGVSRSTDSGATWTDVSPTLAGNPSAIWGSSSGEVYLATASTLWRSTNSGKSWYRQYLNSSDSISHIWGSGASDVFTVTSYSVLHFP
ncbi:MAG TPA: YCF48-related protein [Pseudomonadota bacterium]|nr:YCF48-related protein [Pseudomonadota bacterium]